MFRANKLDGTPTEKCYFNNFEFSLKCFVSRKR